MTPLLAIIISTGAACVSPVAYEPGGMTVHQVPCARPIYAPSANPFKAVQEPNAISVAKAKPKSVKAKKSRKAKRKVRR